MTLFPMIKDVDHRTFCGPTAIALLTGVPVSRVEAMIRRIRGGGYRNEAGRRLPVKSTWTSEVRIVLERLGCKIEPVKVHAPTLGSFVDDVRHAGTFLIDVPHHLMVCSGGMVADTRYNAPVPIEECIRPTRRVDAAWRIKAPSVPRYSTGAAQLKPRAPKPKRDLKEVRAEKIAADIKRWQRKAKLAQTKLKRLRAKQRRYERLGIQIAA
jgi:hypothetical protein